MSVHVPYDAITIEVIDQAIKDWFEETVNSHVADPTADRRKVFVTFGAGERWVSSRSKKGIRDAHGVLILPIIVIRRTTIDPVTEMSALGVETGRLAIARRISTKTSDLKNLAARKTGEPAPATVFEITSIPFPQKAVISYALEIQTQYVTQMNDILQKMFHEMDVKTFVAPLRNRHRHAQSGVPFDAREHLKDPYVVGFFDAALDDRGNFEEFTDQERITKFSTSFKVPTVLQLDPEGEKPSIQVERTAFKVHFRGENTTFVDDPDELDRIFDPDD